MMGATYLGSPLSSRSPHLCGPTTLPLPLMAVAVVALLVVVAVVFPDVGGQVETPKFGSAKAKSQIRVVAELSPQNLCFNCTFYTHIFTLIVFNFNRYMLYNDIFEFMEQSSTIQRLQ